jgi:hypothetical protein
MREGAKGEGAKRNLMGEGRYNGLSAVHWSLDLPYDRMHRFRE